jgi:hypothetical protein
MCSIIKYISNALREVDFIRLQVNHDPSQFFLVVIWHRATVPIVVIHMSFCESIQMCYRIVLFNIDQATANRYVNVFIVRIDFEKRGFLTTDYRIILGRVDKHINTQYSFFVIAPNKRGPVSFNSLLYESGISKMGSPSYTRAARQ